MFPVAKGCDAVLLDLHGAMVTRTYDDGDGELLARIRRIAPQVPIGVALDMHTNLFPAMAQLATVIAGYQTYPHADIPYAGSSAVVVTDGDAAKARALCDELLELAWQAPDKFVYQVEPHDIAAFRVLGIDPASKRYVMLKSRVRRPLYPLDPETRFCSGN